MTQFCSQEQRNTLSHLLSGKKNATLWLMKHDFSKTSCSIFLRQRRWSYTAQDCVCVRVCVAMNKVGPWWKSIGEVHQYTGQIQHNSSCYWCQIPVFSPLWRLSDIVDTSITPQDTPLYANTVSHKLSLLYKQGISTWVRVRVSCSMGTSAGRWVRVVESKLMSHFVLVTVQISTT